MSNDTNTMFSIHNKVKGITTSNKTVLISSTTNNKSIMNGVIHNKREYECSSQSQSEQSKQEPKKKKRKTEKKLGQRDGRWTRPEHQSFLDGLELYGREWKKVAENIPTRSSAQIRSHAQKYFSKISKNNVDGNSNQCAPSASCYNIVSSDDSMSDNGIRRSALSSTALEKVANIISNPSSVQKEVETTLKSLHERYSQLQRMIELRNLRQLHEQDQVVVEQDTVPSTTTIPSVRGPASIALSELQDDQREEEQTRTRAELHLHPDNNPLFGSEELIALHVLRTSLKNPELKKCSNDDDESNHLDIISDE